VVDIPYFAVYGSDIEAGGDFQPTCGTAGGELDGWYDNQAANAGANALFSTIASGQITGVGSAESRVGPNPRPTGLTFANTGGGVISTSALSPGLGGKYGGAHCFYTPAAPNGTVACPGIFTVTAVAGGACQITAANYTVNGGTVGVGKHVGVYVNGDVRITGAGIVYAGSGGGWTIQPGNSTVPSFLLEATGNIYIDPSVTELDGTYVAHGKIYTCDNGGFAPTAAAGMFGGCNRQLTVNGTFTANQINLMRSLGSLDQAAAGEGLSGAPKACANLVGTAPICAAEIFNFSPETYLSIPAAALPSNGAPTYDAISSLPPVL
jgi:hypothetical protein